MMIHLSPSPPARRVLLVGWGGADWKIASPLVDAGELPQLANIMQHGASGPLTSAPPHVEPLLWTSLATGKHAHQHGIASAVFADRSAGKLIPAQSTFRRCKAVWNILSDHGRTAHVIGWRASHPAESVNGVSITEAFPYSSSHDAASSALSRAVFPPALAEEFGPLRLQPGDLDPQILQLFLPRLAEIDLRRDPRPHRLAAFLAETYSLHNAAIAALERGTCDFLGVHYPLIARVKGLFPRFHSSPSTASKTEFALYDDVIPAAYRLQDLLVRDLLAHTVPGTTLIVCSVPGPRHHAPPEILTSPARSQGIFAAAGPGIARDAHVPGVTAVDIAPTLLHLLGFPAAADMNGRILTGALFTPNLPPRISSYEPSGTRTACENSAAPLLSADQSLLLAQLVAHGELPAADLGSDLAVARHDRENRWHLAVALHFAGQHEQAFAALEQLYLEQPEDPRCAYYLALCQISLGLLDDAVAVAETLIDHTPGNLHATFLLGEIAAARGDAETSLRFIEQVAASQPNYPKLAQYRGTALLKQNRVLEAAAAFRDAIEKEPDNPFPSLGYARTLLRLGQPADAETCAREAIARAPTQAISHFTLGLTLAAQNKSDARSSFQHALACDPHFIPARNALQRLAGQPFVLETADITGEVLRPPAHTRLAAEAAARRSALAQKHSVLRASSQPLHRYDPPSEPGRPSQSPPEMSASPVAPLHSRALLEALGFEIRPPWPDEIPRIVAAFPQVRRDAIAYPLVAVVTTGGVERIVGLAAISPPVSGISGFSLVLRPRYLDTPVAGALVTPLAQLARDLGAVKLLTLDELSPDDPRRRALERFGFSLHQELEIWATPLAPIRERVDRVRRRLHHTARHRPLQPRPLSIADLDEVRTLMTSEHLLSGEEIDLGHSATPHRFDPRLSFVVREEGQLAGAILARTLGAGRILIAAEAVGPRWRGGRDLVHHALLGAVIDEASKQGATEFTYSVDATRKVDTARMARRSGSRLVSRCVRLLLIPGIFPPATK